MFARIASIWSWSVCEAIAFFGLALALMIALYPRDPVGTAPRAFLEQDPVFIAGCALLLVWRTLYHTGIGCALSLQSRTGALTCWARTHSTRSGYAGRIIESMLGRVPADLTPDVSAWVLFRACADTILVCDLATWLALCYWLAVRSERLAHYVDLLTVRTLAIDTAAFGLLLFSVWAKIVALRALGAYGWFWGDFFVRKRTFRIDQTAKRGRRQQDFVGLTSMGIFAYFGHPMYTVGYLHYYAVSLFLRSLPLFVVACVIHAAQLSFLVRYEQPHMNHIYDRLGQARNSLPLWAYRRHALLAAQWPPHSPEPSPRAAPHAFAAANG